MNEQFKNEPDFEGEKRRHLEEIEETIMSLERDLQDIMAYITEIELKIEESEKEKKYLEKFSEDEDKEFSTKIIKDTDEFIKGCLKMKEDAFKLKESIEVAIDKAKKIKADFESL